MKITVNAAPHEVSTSTLDALLAELGYTDKSVATALNGAFIPKHARGDTAIKKGDQIEILSPMQGG